MDVDGWEYSWVGPRHTRGSDYKDGCVFHGSYRTADTSGTIIRNDVAGRGIQGYDNTIPGFVLRT